MPLSLIVLAEAVFLHQLHAADVVVALPAVVAVGTFTDGLFWVDLLRESRWLLALPASAGPPP